MTTERIMGDSQYSASEVLAHLRSMIVHKQSLESGVPAPQLRGPGASRQRQHDACVKFAIWAGERDRRYWTQAEVARYLNDCDQRTLRDKPWSQASVSFALRRANVGGRAG